MTVVDSFSPNNEPIGDPAAPATPKGFAGYMATRNGRLIVGGIALVLILAVAGGAFYYYMMMSNGAAPEGFVTQGGNKPTKSAVSGEATPTVPLVPALDETFMFRNVFQPSVRVAAASTSSDSGSGTGSGTSDGGSTSADTSTPGTLYLMGLSEQDGQPVAVFKLNGTEYTVGEGERLGDTPWSVVSISSTEVVMMYGDTRITITLGQGVSK